MSLRKLPQIQAFHRPEGFSWDAPSQALERWAGIAPVAAEADDANTISIYDVIGEDWWTGTGFTDKRMAAALRAIGAKPVTVNVNSPGGDVFQGLAIYNLLREHPAEVTVRVMGIAASIASIIAMAGDKVEMGMSSFLMIHNSWGAVIGNQNDMREAADTFAKFDAAMSDIYLARTGLKAKEIGDMMDAETFITAAEAVKLGFADTTVNQPEPASGGQARAEISARRRLDSILARQGVPRSERRKLMRDATGTQDAADPETMPGAGLDLAAARQLLATMKA